MPRTNLCMPAKQREIAEELRDRYGGMMTATDVMIELGYKHQDSAQAWLADVPAVMGLEELGVGCPCIQQTKGVE